MKKTVEPAVRSVLRWGSSFWEPLAHTLQDRRVVLCFHSVYDEARPNRGYVSNRLRMDIEAFEALLMWLQDWASLVPLDNLMNDEGKGWRIALTFDDGYVDNLNNVLPLLEEYRVPMTWFICTRYVKAPRILPWWDLIDYAESHVRARLSFSCEGEFFDYYLQRPNERKRLRNEQRARFFQANPRSRKARHNALRAAVREATREALPPNGFARPQEVTSAADSYWITIGAHAHTHQNLGACSEPRVAREIAHSRSVLQEWTGQSVQWFAYPFGGPTAWTETVARRVEEQGFRGAFTLTPDHIGCAPHRWAIPRISIDPQWNLTKVRTRIFGADLFREGRRVKQWLQ